MIKIKSGVGAENGSDKERRGDEFERMSRWSEHKGKGRRCKIEKTIVERGLLSRK